jgi:GNAT superfamily N-acetyltransferase
MTAAPEEARALAADADRIEARAWADWFAAVPPGMRSEFGMKSCGIADTTLLLAPRIPSTLFNRAIGLGMTRPATGEDLETVVKAFHGAGCPAFGVTWGPFSAPAALTSHLDALLPAASPRPRIAKMVRGAAPAPAATSDLRIVALDRSLVGETARAISQGFGTPFLAPAVASLFWRPRWHLYAAMDRDAVVGGAALFLDGHRAWLGICSVLPTHRRRGAQSGLLAQRIRDAIAAGATQLFTETGEPSETGANPSLNNMERSGFEKVVSRTDYVAATSGVALVPDEASP